MRVRGALAAAAAYFAAVFACGFVLGVPRSLMLEPALGRLLAVLCELPAMLGLAWWICRAILRRVPLDAPGAALMGVAAFALLMVAEAMLSTLLGGRSLAAHWALYAEASHRLGLAGQLVFGAMPWIQVRAGLARSGAKPPR